MARIHRRKLLQLSGAGAVAAKTGGIAAILATGRAPAYAQGRGGQPPAPVPASQVESASRNEVAGPAEEKISQTFW